MLYNREDILELRCAYFFLYFLIMCFHRYDSLHNSRPFIGTEVVLITYLDIIKLPSLCKRTSSLVFFLQKELDFIDIFTSSSPEGHSLVEKNTDKLPIKGPSDIMDK